MPFTATPAELIPSAQDVMTGDLTVRAFSRIARFTGLSTPGLLSAAPPLTFASNLLNVEAPARNWDLETFAGLGLSLELDTIAGNAPQVVARAVVVNTPASTGFTYTYPTPRSAGQLLIVVVATAALSTIGTMSGFTLVGTQAGTESRISVFSKLLVGTEPSTELLTLGTSTACVVRSWLYDIADGTVEALAGTNDSAAGTSLDLGTISPSWAVTDPVNTSYLAVLGLADDQVISAFPAGYTTTGQDSNASATADEDVTLGYAEVSALGSSENPGAFTYGACRANAFVIAIAPAAAARLNWDGLEVRKAAAAIGTRRALNLVEGTGITLTMTDNAGTGAVDVIIDAAPGGGAGWDDVLLVDAHTGASNPIIDDAQHIQFGIAAPPATGQIRTNEPFLINGDKDVDITAGEGITLDAVDSILIDTASGNVDINAFGSIEFAAGTNWLVNTDAVERFRISSDGAWGLSGAVFGSAGQVITSQGPLTPPVWSTLIGVVDGDKGDITISALGTVYTIDDNAVTPAKLFDVNARSVLCKATAGAGDAEMLAILSNGILVRNGAGDLASLQLGGNCVVGRLGSGNPTIIQSSAANQILLRGSGSLLFAQINDDEVLGVSGVGGTLASSKVVTNMILNDNVTNTKLANMPANTLKANPTAGAADPDDLAIVAESVVGRTSGNLQNITSSLQSILMRSSGSVFWGTAAADQVLRRSGSGDLGFGTLVTNNIGDDQVTNAKLANMAANTVKVNATTGSANPTDLAMAANTALLRAGGNIEALAVGTNTVLGRAGGNIVAAQLVDAQVATNTLNFNKLQQLSARRVLGNDSNSTADVASLDQLELNVINSLPNATSAHSLCWIDEDFDHLVRSAGSTAGTALDVFVPITNGSASSWAFAASSGTMTIDGSEANTVGHSGIVEFITGATSNNDAQIFMLGGGIDFDDVVSADFWVQLPIDTSVRLRVGFTEDGGDASWGTDAVHFQFSTAVSANWQTITRAASTSTTTTSGVAPGTAWHKLTIWRESSSSVRFFIDNSLVASHTTNIPTNVITPVIQVQTLTSGARSFKLDRIRIFADDSAMLA